MCLELKTITCKIHLFSEQTIKPSSTNTLMVIPQFVMYYNPDSFAMLDNMPFLLRQTFGMHGHYAFFFHALAVNIAQVKGLIVCFIFQKWDFQSSQLTPSSEKFQLGKLEFSMALPFMNAE